MVPGQTSAVVGTTDFTQVRTLTVLPGLAVPGAPPRVAIVDETVDGNLTIDLAEATVETAVESEVIDLTAVEAPVAIPLQREGESDPFGPADRWDVKRRDEFTVELEDRLQSGETIAMIAIDLDRFGQLTAAHGHEAGDVALRNAHRVLRWTLGPGNVAYFGSDSFAALLPYDGVRTTCLLDSALDQISRTDLGDLTGFYTTASAGMVVVDDVAVTSDVVLFEAERVMLSAKEMGGNVAVVEELAVRSLSATE